MAIEVSELSTDQTKRILQFEESHFLDLKAVDIKPAKISRHIAALANADGGEIYVGIDELDSHGSRQWRGFQNQEAANSLIQCVEDLFPFGSGVLLTFLKSPQHSGLVLKIEIDKSHDIKYASDGVPYLRRGAQSLPQKTEDQLTRLRLNKGITTFENETISVEPDVITNSITSLNFMIEIVPTAEPDAWMKKQKLLRDSGVTVAGLILYADEPQIYLPKQSSIKVYQYKTSDPVGSRETLEFQPETIEGPAYGQITKAVDRTVEIVENLKILGPQGLEQAKYPRETLHEIITNAVIHRDYSIQDDIHIRVFENRIEVQSPGTLPGHVTVSNILEERASRNGTIVRLINKFPNPPNKDVGEGLNTAFEAMRRIRLKDPTIEIRESSLLVTVKHEPLASPEERVLEYLQYNESINNSKAREICHIGSENVVKRIFERLMARDLIERIPDKRGRATAYRLTEKGKDASAI